MRPASRSRSSAWIVRESDARVVAARTFAAEAAAPSTDTLPLVMAFDRATGQVLTRITGWTLSTVGVAVSTPRS